MKPEIKIGYLLSGDFLPEDITNILGISPTQSWQKGDTIKGTTLVRKFTGWFFSIEEKPNSYELVDHIEPLLSKLLPKKEIISELIKRYKMEAEINCSIYLADETPVMYLSPEIVEGVSDLKASIDIDINLITPN